MNRILALLLAVALLGFAVWSVLRPASPAALAPETNPPVAQETQLEDIPELPAPAAKTVPKSTVERTAFVPTPLLKDSRARYGTEAQEGVLVSVIDADSLEALPYAEVLVIDFGTIDGSLLEFEMMRQPDFESLFLHFGLVYSTNALGQVRVPFPEKNMWVAGRTQTHFDFRFDVDLEEGTLSLPIKRVELLRIHVVDEAGTPLTGVPVGLRLRDDGNSTAFMRNATNQEGWADLRLFQLLLDNLASSETSAALLGVFENPIEVPVNLNDLPAEGVTLISPAVGSIQVTLVHPDGQKVKEQVAVSLQALSAAELQNTGNTNDAKNNPDFLDTAEDGVLFIPSVGLDLNLRIEARSNGGVLSATQRLLGPTATQRKVQVRLEMKMEAAVIRGRIVNEKGMVGKNLTLQARFEQQSGQSSSSAASTIRTDRKGVFRFKLDHPNHEPASQRTLTLSLEATRRKPLRNAFIDLNRNFPAGETDLGDIVLSAPPVVVGGVVLKPDGTPLHDAEVGLELRKQWLGSGNQYWHNLPPSRVRTDHEGRFSISGRFAAGEYRLRINSRLFPSLFHPVTLGAEELIVTMVAGGSLRGTLLLDEGLPRDAVQLHLLRHPFLELDDYDRGELGVTINHDGSFLRQGISRGTVDVIVRAKRGREELFRRNGVTLGDSAENPYDLGVIDLRGQLQWFALHLVDTRGKAMRKVRVVCDEDISESTTRKGKFEVITKKASKSFVLTSPGYRTVRLKDVSEDTTVTFSKGLPVRVRVSNPELVPHGYLMSLRLRQLTNTSMRGRQVGGQMDQPDASYEQSMTAPDSGRFVVDCFLANAATVNTKGWWRTSTNAESMQIEVLDLPEEQYFTVTLSQKEIENTVAKLRGD